MGFRPLHDRVLVRRIEADEKTAGGIIIPDTAKEKPRRASCPGRRLRRPQDKVLFGKWSGTEVKVDGEGPVDHEGVRHHGHR